MINKPDKNKLRKKRHLRIRKKISGTGAIPRLNVFRSNRHIYAAIVDDSIGHTLAAVTSKSFESELGSTSNKDAAVRVGKAIAEKAIAAGFEKVVFDRSGYIYHGRIKELADAAREAGLKF
jgi:large subunit ribosomal protein L18